MADVENPHFTIGDAVVDDVGIPSQPVRMNAKFLDERASPRVLSKACDPLLDECLDLTRRARVPVLEIFEDFLAVRKGVPGESTFICRGVRQTPL
jgi:hypothetical protein